VELFQKGLPVVLLVLIRCVSVVGMEKTERAFGITVEAKLKGHVCHSCANLTTGDKRACTHSLMRIMVT